MKIRYLAVVLLLSACAEYAGYKIGDYYPKDM